MIYYYYINSLNSGLINLKDCPLVISYVKDTIMCIDIESMRSDDREMFLKEWKSALSKPVITPVSVSSVIGSLYLNMRI